MASTTIATITTTMCAQNAFSPKTRLIDAASRPQQRVRLKHEKALDRQKDDVQEVTQTCQWPSDGTIAERTISIRESVRAPLDRCRGRSAVVSREGWGNAIEEVHICTTHPWSNRLRLHQHLQRDGSHDEGVQP